MAAKQKNEEYMIVNRRTGKALQSTGLDNGQVVVQQAPDGTDAQIWTSVKSGKAVKLINKASGKVLDVMHGGTEAGSWAQTWEDVGGDSQLWQWVKLTATYRKLINVQSGKALDIVDMREDDGAPAQIWDDVDGAGQQWKLVAAADKPQEETPAEVPAEEKPQKEEAKKEEKKEAPKKEAPKKTAAEPKKARGEKAEEKAAPAVKSAPVAEAPAEKPAPKRKGRKTSNT